MPRSALQAIVGARVPRRKGQFGLALTLCDPLVQLDGAPGRMGIALTLRLSGPREAERAWRGLVAVRVDYDRQRGQLRLLEPTLQRFDLCGVPVLRRSTVLRLAASLLAPVLPAAPIYTLPPGTLQHAIAGLLLRRITVGDDELVVELGLEPPTLRGAAGT